MKSKQEDLWHEMHCQGVTGWKGGILSEPDFAEMRFWLLVCKGSKMRMKAVFWVAVSYLLFPLLTFFHIPSGTSDFLNALQPPRGKIHLIKLILYGLRQWVGSAEFKNVSF